jgi:hypothetical protein
MAPLSPEAKAALLKRLAEGRAKTKAARAEAKEKGMADPKPRKVRKDKKAKVDKNGHAEPVDPKEAIVDPLANKPEREEVRPIDGAKPEAVNTVGAMPPDPESNATSKIDVPNLPDKKGRKKIVQEPEVLPEAKGPKDLSTTGRTKKIDDNVMLTNKETGNQVITDMVPGQKESVKKTLRKNKTENKPEAVAPVPNPPEYTVKNVLHHVPDVKAIEARAPFSFSAIRKALYQ